VAGGTVAGAMPGLLLVPWRCGGSVSLPRAPRACLQALGTPARPNASSSSAALLGARPALLLLGLAFLVVCGQFD
jgi:hypothetical protein